MILVAALFTVTATSYCQPGRMADGTITRPGSVASNAHRLGTRLRLAHPIFGHRIVVVRDRIGWGSQLDIFTSSCTAARRFGRRRVSYRVVGS